MLELWLCQSLLLDLAYLLKQASSVAFCKENITDIHLAIPVNLVYAFCKKKKIVAKIWKWGQIPALIAQLSKLWS